MERPMPLVPCHQRSGYVYQAAECINYHSHMTVKGWLGICIEYISRIVNGSRFVVFCYGFVQGMDE